MEANAELTTTVRVESGTDSWFTILWVYISVAFTNVVFHGLLSMHALLDNPYGNHCCKFPLRAQITEVLNATRTLLCRADDLPSMFLDIFDGHATASYATSPRPAPHSPQPATVRPCARGKLLTHDRFDGSPSPFGSDVVYFTLLITLSMRPAATAGLLVAGQRLLCSCLASCESKA